MSSFGIYNQEISATAPGSGHRTVSPDAPLLAAFVAAAGRDDTPFCVPGHKGRTRELDGDLGLVTDADVPLYAGLDTMKLTGRTLDLAEALAARLWGADWCRFSVGGATQANQALLLAAGQPGGQIVMARSIHRSVFSGLILAGLQPVWLPPRADPATTLPLGPTPEQLAAALDAAPGAVAVWLSEPSYLGTVADMAALAAVAHGHGVPLLVDQAWGAHLGFHPGYPAHALQAGADAMVISAHKMLPAYSQAALVLARGGYLSPGRLETAFDATSTTSPAGAILASIDGARALLASRGHELLDRLAGLVAGARQALAAACPGLVTPGPGDFPPGRFDPAKLVLSLAGTGADGTRVELASQAVGVPLEMADRDTIVATVTMADTPYTVGRLVEVAGGAIAAGSGRPRPAATGMSWTLVPQSVVDPRTAFFAPWTTVPAGRAPGRVSAELIAAYPPGVPILAPGELITHELLEALRRQSAEGSRIAYAADP
ncbi:MAG TPA: DegT/DnrJ/EryC1/StrS family aminotransferase, partial [Streptosporangiaceae bacterium]